MPHSSSHFDRTYFRQDIFYDVLHALTHPLHSFNVSMDVVQAIVQLGASQGLKSAGVLLNVGAESLSKSAQRVPLGASTWAAGSLSLHVPVMRSSVRRELLEGAELSKKASLVKCAQLVEPGCWSLRFTRQTCKNR